MTPEAQRIAIAEACGWTDIRMEEGQDVDIESREIYPWHTLRGTFNDERRHVIWYDQSLDAMHTAEKVLTVPQKRLYFFTLKEACEPSCEYWRATAAQRAEAFLRAVGKWEGKA